LGRYTGPVCRLCRREGQKLYLKSDRCFSDKCAIDRRSYVPGQHGQGRKKVSGYGTQLREKQKAKRYYGVMESQFRKYFDMAEGMKGVTGENLLQILERRLDNVVFRIGMAGSRKEARQLIKHGHFTVNGKKVNIPSYLVKVGEVIQVTEKSKASEKFKGLVEGNQRVAPDWLEVDLENYRARVVALPRKEHVDIPIEEHLIVELYSR
jgi:small subunit ribosomal protein S4